MKIAVLTSAIFEATLLSLAQIDFIPNDLISIFIQLPLIGLFSWYVLKKDRDTRDWIDHLMEEQEKRYDRTISLFERIMDRQDERLAQIRITVSELNQQLILNTATVNESMRLGELAEELKRLADNK